MNVTEDSTVPSAGTDYQPKLVAAFDEESRHYIGIDYAQPDPLTPGEYYAPPNTVDHFPRDLDSVGYGLGYRLSSDGSSWAKSVDYSLCKLYTVCTLEEWHDQLKPGQHLPSGVVPVAPPYFEDGQWPRWDDKLGEWVIGRNMAGVHWHRGEETGQLTFPWDTMPDGATEGEHPSIIHNRRHVAMMNQVLECKHRIEALELALEIDSSSKSSVVNKNMLKLYQSCLTNTVAVDIYGDDFALPELPNVT